MSSLLVKTAIWGYHVYRVVWEPRVGESFVVLHESGNDNGRHAMAVCCDEDPGVIVGHLLREISKTCHYFIRHKNWTAWHVCLYRLRHCGNSCASLFEGYFAK